MPGRIRIKCLENILASRELRYANARPYEMMDGSAKCDTISCSKRTPRGNAYGPTVLQPHRGLHKVIKEGQYSCSLAYCESKRSIYGVLVRCCCLGGGEQAYVVSVSGPRGVKMRGSLTGYPTTNSPAAPHCFLFTPTATPLIALSLSSREILQAAQDTPVTWPAS